MKPRLNQPGARENTASSRQHASRLALSSSLLKSAKPSENAPEDKQSLAQVSSPAETIRLSLGEPENGATGEVRDDATGLATELNVRGDRSGIERPLTCEEAAELVRVHPKTVKRMARGGKVPGHFRFGRWFFYATELDCWMRTELHSSRHSCR
ncbi:MAG: helix-turn-helix domain-containing protein [Candidatus Acidiferrales bacterium]|jgi:excisionase family DNA binding protein